MIRADASLKLAGRAEYGTDLERPGMLWAALVPSPVAHGRIRRIDLEPARSRPGVVAAIGAAELAELLPRGSGDPDRPLFPAREVRYRHEPVAAVAALRRADAYEAARRVRLEIDPLPVKPDLDSVFPDWPGPDAKDHPSVNAHVRARSGDPEGLFARADRIRSEEFRTSGVVQMPLEPHACLAEVSDGRWFVRSSTQTPFGARDDTAAILGLPPESVVIEGSWVGGGFGGKGAALLEPYALALAAAAGAPVKLCLTYEEEFRLTRSTLPARIWIESAVVGRRAVARRVRLLLDTGAALPGRDFATGYSIGFLLGPYRLDAMEIEGYAVRTNKPPFGPHRAPLLPQLVFAAEGHIDGLAHELGVDPIRFREESLWRPGDRTHLGQEVGPFAAASALERARELRERWRRELPEGTGFGVALGYWSTGVGAGGEAEIALSEEGVELRVGEREIGSGSVVRGLAAVAERALGLPPEAIRLEYLDTSRAPFDSGVFGSRTLGALGGAVLDAAGKLLRGLGERAGGPATLRWTGGTLRVVAGGRERRLAELLREEERRTGAIVVRGECYGAGAAIDEKRVLAGEFFGHSDFTATVHLAAVDVDRETGQVTVVRSAAIQDAGEVVDRPTFVAQVEGAVAMGLGAALTEETLWDPDGRLLNPGLLDYRIPTLSEVPPIEVVVLTGAPGAGPFGAKGIGEPPIIPVPAAIGNAIYDATGARLTELPFTPERVARALKRP